MKSAKSTGSIGADKNRIKRAAPASGQTIALKHIAAKTAAEAQFNKIKEALEEVAGIEAGKIKPKSLDDLLNEL